MGKISIEKSFPDNGSAPHLRSSSSNYAVTKHGVYDFLSQTSEHNQTFQSNASKHETGIEHIEEVSIQKDYPILPRHVSQNHLPLIDAAEVVKRDGQGDRRLCEFCANKELRIRTLARLIVDRDCGR